MKFTRESFAHMMDGTGYEWSANSPEPRLTVRRAGPFDGYEAVAHWPSRPAMLKCGAKTIEEAQDGLLAALDSPPPAGQVYFFWAKEKV